MRIRSATASLPVELFEPLASKPTALHSDAQSISPSLFSSLSLRQIVEGVRELSTNLQETRKSRAKLSANVVLAACIGMAINTVFAPFVLIATGSNLLTLAVVSAGAIVPGLVALALVRRSARKTGKILESLEAEQGLAIEAIVQKLEELYGLEFSVEQVEELIAGDGVLAKSTAGVVAKFELGILDGEPVLVRIGEAVAPASKAEKSTS